MTCRCNFFVAVAVVVVVDLPTEPDRDDTSVYETHAKHAKILDEVPCAMDFTKKQRGYRPLE